MKWLWLLALVVAYAAFIMALLRTSSRMPEAGELDRGSVAICLNCSSHNVVCFRHGDNEQYAP